MSDIDLSKLSEPFPLEDIEWRVSRAGVGKSGIFCMVIPYITARAIQKRLDDVCGVENWQNEEPRMVEVNGSSAFVGGISLRIDNEWITKWDVSEPTNIEPAKGGFSGAMKRAGAQLGIGRYLYYLDEVFAETAEQPPTVASKQWHYAKLPEKHGGGIYYWKSPSLPGWALPKEPEHEITVAELTDLKMYWKGRCASDTINPSELREGFTRFVTSLVGEFPHGDHSCWTRDAFAKCWTAVKDMTETNGVSGDVPFDA